MTATEKLSIAIYQHAPAEVSPEARLNGLEQALRQGAGSSVDLVLCPELFLSGYAAGARLPALAEAPDGPFSRSVGDIARRHGCGIVYGYPEAFGGAVYNAAVALGNDGSCLANHRKTVLPTDYERTWFRRGDGLTFFTVAGWKIAIIICYEVEFPEIVRACAVNGADLVVAPTALTREWDVVSRQVVPARAFENGVYVAYANYGGAEGDVAYLGESCIVGPDGRDLARAGAGEAVIGAVLDPTALDRVRRRLAYLTDSETLGTLRKPGFIGTSHCGATVEET